MTYKEYKEQEDTITPITKEEYLRMKHLVENYENAFCEEDKPSIFTNDDVELFNRNFEKSMDDLLYSDDDFPSSVIEDFVEWRKKDGYNTTMKFVVSQIEDDFNRLMEEGHPHGLMESGNIRIETSLHDHSVTILLFVGITENFDDEKQ